MFETMRKLFANSVEGKQSRTKAIRAGQWFQDLEERIVPASFSWDNTDTLATLNADIATINSNSDPDTITFTSDVSFSGDLTAFTFDGGNAVSIEGANFMMTQTSGVNRVLRNNGATLSINQLTVTGGSVAASGGGILNQAGTLSITNSAITGNSTTGVTADGHRGGGIANISGATIALISFTTISNNNTNDDGGGFNNAGLITEISNSTISGNSSDPGGASSTAGGFRNSGTISLIANTTISGNIDNSTGDAGAAFINAGGTITNFVNNTVTENSAPLSSNGAGGIRNSAGTMTNVVSNIVANNTIMGGVQSDVVGTFTNAADNIVGDDTGLTIISDNGGNQLNTDPMLNPVLANNGGPTLTHALLLGSPAINAGSNPQGLTTDQRGPGFPRNVDGGVDVGSVEFDAAPPPPAPVSVVDGTLYIPLDGSATLTQLSSSSVNVVLNTVNLGNFTGVRRIVVQGGANDDTLTLANVVDIPLYYAGAGGNDTLDASAVADRIVTFIGPNSKQPSQFDSIEILSVGYTIFLPGADLTGTINANGHVLDFSRIGYPINANLDAPGMNVNWTLAAQNVDYAIGQLFGNNKISPANKNATNFLGRNL